MLLALVLLVLMAYYLRVTRAADSEGRRDGGMITWFKNPWGKPRALVVVTVLYLAWAILPVAIAILFAFNDGRSRTTWQGFSFAVVHR